MTRSVLEENKISLQFLQTRCITCNEEEMRRTSHWGNKTVVMRINARDKHFPFIVYLDAVRQVNDYQTIVINTVVLYMFTGQLSARNVKRNAVKT